MGPLIPMGTKISPNRGGRRCGAEEENGWSKMTQPMRKKMPLGVKQQDEEDGGAALGGRKNN